MSEDDSKTRRSAQVPGQYLGYSLQGTRFLLHLLRGQPGMTVSLEVFGDVGSETLEGERITEEDKSALTANPISDRAVPLWKTLRNWVDAVKRNELKPLTTEFVIYVSRPVEGAIATAFSEATDPVQAVKALRNARDLLWGPEPALQLQAGISDGIRDHVAVVFEANEDLVASIIRKTKIEFGSGSPQDDILTELTSLTLMPPALVENARVFSQGWVKVEIDKLLEQQKPSAISVDRYRAALLGFIRSRDNRTVLAPVSEEPTNDEIQKDMHRKVYVRQLDIIDIDEEAKLRAVSDYSRAVADRVAWCEEGIVTSESLDSFADELTRYWRNSCTKTEIAFSKNSEEERGCLLYADCSQYSAGVQGMAVGAYFVSGSYHALADGLDLGWHPRFERILGQEGFTKE